MSTAEPFMPAHEPPLPVPDAERDIDGYVDVILEPANPDAPAADDPVPADAPEPPIAKPAVGEQLTREQLEADLDGQSA